MVREAAGVASQHALEAAANDPERAAHGSFPPSDSAGLNGKIEGTAYPMNSELVRNAGHRIQYGRKQVCVLMRIQMRGIQAGMENPVHLRPKLVVDANAFERDRVDQIRDRSGKSRRSHKNQVASDVERGVFFRQPHRILESSSWRHECGGSQDPVPVRFYDAAVHITCEAEIVGIDY